MTLLFAVCGGVCGAATVTNYWTCAAGSGAWTTADNWSLGHAPLATEYAFVSNEVDGAIIDFGETPVTIKALIVGAPGKAVTNALWFTGAGLTLTESFTGHSISSDGVAEIPNMLVPLQIRSRSTVAFDVPVTFGTGKADTGIWHGATTGQTLTFLKDIHVPGSKIFYVHGNSAAYIDIVGTVDHPDGILREFQYACGNTRFYGPVHAKGICKGADYNNPLWSFYNVDTTYEEIQISHSTRLHQAAPGVFATNHVLDVIGHPSKQTYRNGGCFYNLGDQPRTVVDRLATSGNAETWGLLMIFGTTYFGGAISSAALADCKNSGYGHARLTLRGTADDLSGLALYGAYGTAGPEAIHSVIDLEWDPVGDFTQTLTGRVHYTWGSLTVKRGTLKVSGAASFQYVPRIAVLSGEHDATFDLDVTTASALKLVRWIDLQGAKARFRIGPSATTPFASDLAIALIDAGAKFTMPTGASASLMAVVYDGARVANGTYTGGETTASATHADWIDGEGTVKVTGAEKLAYWTGAESGAYETAANWAGGAAPSASTTALAIDRATDAPLAITVNDKIAAFPTDVLIRNRGTAATTLSIEADVEHEKGNVLIEKGGKVQVKNATYTYTGTYAALRSSPSAADQLSNRRQFRVTEGGEWVTDAGGQSLINYFIGSFLVDGSASLTGRVAAVNGGYMKFLGWASYPLHAHPHGLLEALDGGWFHIPHYSYDHKTTLDLHGGKINVKDATFGGTNICGGSILYGQGDICFSGATTNREGNGSSVQQVFGPVASGEKTHIVMNDKCYNDIRFYLGSEVGSETVLDYGSSTPNNLNARIGVYGGKSTLNLTGTGEFIANYYGLQVGRSNGSGTTPVEGYVNVPTGTKLNVGGSTSSGAANGSSGNLGSLAVGYGQGASSEPTYMRNAYGAVRVTGGTVSQTAGHALIGIGRGEGLYVQDGGSSTLTTGSTVVGLAGGLGHVVVSNGTLTTHALYVGGCPQAAFTYGATWESTAGIPFSSRHDAEGTLTVAGGTLSAAGYDTTVGLDGDGTVEMIGAKGSLTTRNLLLTNGVHSAVRFVTDEDAKVSPIKVTGALKFSPGSKLTVDYTAASSPRRVTLFTFDTCEGLTDDMLEVIGGGDHDFCLSAADGKLTLSPRAGMVIRFY